MKNQFLRIAGWFGIATPILSLTLVFVSVAMSPWFSWHANALSDMGVSATPNPFNFGLIAGGLLYIVFAIGLWKWISVDSSVATIGKVALMLGSIALPLIGVINEDFDRLHYIVAATYFLATPLGYLLIGAVMLKRGEQVPGLLTIAAGIAAILAITLVPHQKIAVPEILASVIMGSWTFAMGVKLPLDPVRSHA
jgi:hypothetical membrane protein